MEDQKKVITVDDLYNHITSQMSAEQALKILLASSIVEYQKLKFPEPEKAVHPLIIMTMAAMDLGWMIAVEKDQEEVRGLSVGTQEYMDKIFPKQKS